MNDTIDHIDESNENHAVDFNALDGFTVSSSSRPFLLNKFSNECNTWPSETDFSWSQTQVSFFSILNFEEMLSASVNV